MRVGSTGFVIYLIALLPPLFAPTVLSGVELSEFIKVLAPGIALGLAGLIFSWIAWWGPVEPLNRRSVEQQRDSEQPSALPLCGICQRGVEPAFQTTCTYGGNCEKVFHKGCLVAKQASFQGDPRLCPACNIRIA